MAVDPFLKPLVFCSFQICQETSANKESIPGRLLVGMPDRSHRHQDLTVGAGCGSYRPRACSTRNQTSVVNGQFATMWSIDSST
jgi:hypothetical protein